MGQQHGHSERRSSSSCTDTRFDSDVSSTFCRCRFHRIKLLRHPSAPTFIVPGCAIAHDKLKEEGAQYCGEASEAENERKVNFDAEDLLAEEHHSLSRIVGLNMLPDVCILPEAKLAIEQAEGRGMMVKEEDVETFDDTQAKTQAAVDEEDETHVDEVLPEVVISPGIPRHQAGEEDDVFSSAVAKERGSRATSEASSGGQSGGKQARQRRKSRKSDPRGDNADFKPAPGDSDEDEESSARRAKRGRKSAASKAEEHAEADLGGRQNGEDAASDLGEALTSFEEGRLGTGEGAEDGEGIAEALTRAGSNLEDAVGGAANLSAPSSPKAKRRSRRSRTSDPTFKPIKAEEVSDEDEKDGLTSAPARRKSRGGRKSLSVQVPAEELRSLADAVEGTPEQQAVENGSEDGAGTAASASASASSSAGKRKRGRKSDPGAANAAFKPEPTASDESDGEDTVGDKRALRKRKTENGAAPVRGSDADEQGARDDNAREEAMGAQTPSKSGGLLGRLKFW